ncbi:cell wall cysteine-rich protein [Aspergillus thermomutatus]|uniref:Uncharacterized protein n=1 Tax=Aspergillus thermomutatus TaxID=41047 RepID=A0A397GLN3_ASPTH|nr:uncharacterized protein CDV56_105864 [Aspergillus thermomutatus]RHZ50386.1 hypothetical protein CDV56_105864 [Aspergillus thermomutatus]
MPAQHELRRPGLCVHEGAVVPFGTAMKGSDCISSDRPWRPSINIFNGQHCMFTKPRSEPPSSAKHAVTPTSQAAHQTTPTMAATEELTPARNVRRISFWTAMFVPPNTSFDGTNYVTSVRPDRTPGMSLSGKKCVYGKSSNCLPGSIFDGTECVSSQTHL